MISGMYQQQQNKISVIVFSIQFTQLYDIRKDAFYIKHLQVFNALIDKIHIGTQYI